MYLSGDDYDRMAKLVIDIYTDYTITSFPVDEKEICKKMGIKLVPYSSYPEEQRDLLIKRSNDAFFIPSTKQGSPIICYNNLIDSQERIRFSIFHELKHYANNDTEDDIIEDKLADYFARYFMVPIPYLIHTGVDDIATIICEHKVSYETASYALSNIRNRKNKYGSKIFDYEFPLIDLLCK